MADDGITVIVGGESAGKAAKNAKSKAGKAQEADTKVKGVSKKEEPLEKKIDRIEKTLTKGMKDILKALNGEKKDESKKLKGAASGILENISSAVGIDEDEAGDESEKEDAFEKASKLTKLKPQDINIVDKQWILGSLLINSTLTDILDFLKKNISSKASSGKSEGSNESNNKTQISGGEIKLGDFMVALEDFMYVAPRILVDSSKQLKKVSWTALIIAAEVLPFFFKRTKDTFQKIYENADKYKDISKAANNIKNAYINLALAGLIATLGIPFYLTGTIGALAAIPFVAATKLLYKFVPSPADSLKSTLSALLMVPFFTAMWINVKLASSLAKISIKDTLMGMANIGIVAAAGAIVFAILGIPVVAPLIALGAVTALAMAIGIFAFTLITPKVAEIGAYNYKDVLTGTLNMGIVAVSSAIIFSLLGLASPLIALGTISAIMLTVGITVMYAAMKMAIKAGKISEEAIHALGFLDKGVLNGDDPAGKNNSTGLFGFLSKFGSFKIIKLLLLSILPAGLLALVGVLLTVGGFLINSGLKQFAKIGTDYFPDNNFAKSKPVLGILGLLTFVDILDNGLPGTDGKGKVGYGTVLSLIPLVLFGVVLKFAADQIKKGLDAFSEIKINDKAYSTIDDLKTFIDNLSTKLLGKPDSKGNGIIAALGSVFGPLMKAGDYLLQMIPLLTLGLYGAILAAVAKPLSEGIDAMLSFADKGSQLKKLTDKDGPFDKIVELMKKMSVFTKDIATWGLKDLEGPTQAVKTVCESFAIIVPPLLDLAKVNNGLVNVGISNSKLLIDDLFVKDDGFKGAFNSIKNFGKADISAFNQVSDLIKAINPMATMVIDMAKLDNSALNRGINAMISLIEAINKMTGGLANGEEGKIDKLLSIWQNNSGSNQIENSPLFKVLDILSNKDFANSEFEKNVQIMSNGLDKISGSITRFQETDMSKFSTFASTIGNAGITNGINQIERLAGLDPQLRLIASDLQSIANSLNEIAANSGSLSNIGEAFGKNIPQADEISKVTTKQDLEVQSTMWQKAIQDYMANIYNMMTIWNTNGMKVYMDMPKTPEAPLPEVSMSTAQNMF